MKKTSNAVKRFVRLATMVLAICLMMSATVKTAFAVNENVQSASKGVLQLNLVYHDDYNRDVVLKTGTSFLINENTIVSCAHCTTLSDSELEQVAAYVNKSPNETFNRLGYTVTISRDVTVKATVQKLSEEVDFAILTLETSLKDREPLTMRHSSTVQQTEVVYAIGFPGQSAIMQDINKYTPDDVTITDGRVNKVATGKNLYSGANTDYIQSSCKMTSGNSGGPMLDDNGYVVGICQGATGEETSGDYFYSICIDQVLAVCDSLGIRYNLDGDNQQGGNQQGGGEENPPAPTDEVNFSALVEALNKAKALNKAEYTPSSYALVENAIAAAEQAKSADTQEAVDTAARSLNEAMTRLQPAPQEEKGGLGNLLYIIIGAVVVLIIAIVLIVVLSSNKKKPAPKQPVPTATAKIPTPAQTPAAIGSGFAPSQMQVPQGARPGTVPLTPEAGATTVLSQGAGETTVLSQKVNGGSLIRRKTGERIDINIAEFLMGRERKRVTYCVADNTNVSRVHAKLTVRNGMTYLIDMGAANGTFVNGVKATPNQEITLKNGDKITLADEEFEFKA